MEGKTLGKKTCTLEERQHGVSTIVTGVIYLLLYS